MAAGASHKGTDSGAARKNRGQDLPQLMPTLFRFAVTLLVLAGIAYGAMFALVLFVEPKQAELSVRIPPEKLLPQR